MTWREKKKKRKKKRKQQERKNPQKEVNISEIYLNYKDPVHSEHYNIKVTNHSLLSILLSPAVLKTQPARKVRTTFIKTTMS